MTAKLISITPDAEKNMMFCARVSSNDQESTDTKLLSYCAKNKHWSIFEMATMTVEINTSRAIARQILRHRSFHFQEFSQRYAEVTAPPIINEARSQDHKNRQSSHDDMKKDDKEWFEAAQARIWVEANDMYQEALKRGVAKECARAFLPEGITPSKMYMSGTIRDWIHYIDLRSGNGTQKEHRDIAEDIQKIFDKQLPTVAAAMWET